MWLPKPSTLYDIAPPPKRAEKAEALQKKKAKEPYQPHQPSPDWLRCRRRPGARRWNSPPANKPKGEQGPQRPKPRNPERAQIGRGGSDGASDGGLRGCFGMSSGFSGVLCCLRGAGFLNPISLALFCLVAFCCFLLLSCFLIRSSTEKGRFIMKGLRMCDDDAAWD